eukprot:14900825-Heterocapsa_arctica.AAC.1
MSRNDPDSESIIEEYDANWDFDEEEAAALDEWYVDEIIREYDEEAYLYNIEGQDDDDSKLDIGVVAEGEVWISWDSRADEHVAPT